MSKGKKEQSVEVNLPQADKHLKELGGSDFGQANNIRVNQALRCLWLPEGMDEKDRHEAHVAAAQTLAGINPKDDIEGMLAAQMVATNSAIMECYRRSMINGQTFEGRNQNLAFANKLSRAFAQQVEALQRYRGKGQQKMIVEHVHVHAGGQAIVGTVTPSEGGGAITKTEEQPHAKQISHEQSTYAPVQALPCFDKEKDPLPVSRNVKRQMPDARRQVHRSAEGK